MGRGCPGPLLPQVEGEGCGDLLPCASPQPSAPQGVGQTLRTGSVLLLQTGVPVNVSIGVLLLAVRWGDGELPGGLCVQ